MGTRSSFGTAPRPSLDVRRPKSAKIVATACAIMAYASAFGPLLRSAVGLPGTTCTGDCDQDQAVTIAEIVFGVGLLLNEDGGQCPAFDADGNGKITVDEILAAIDYALAGCPPLPPATLTATATPSPTPTPLLREAQTEIEGVNGIEGLQNARAVAVSPDGNNVYVASDSILGCVSEFSRDRSTGRLTYLGVMRSDRVSRAISLSVSPDGDHVYVAAVSAAAVTLHRDRQSGLLSALEMPATALTRGHSVTVSPDGAHVYAGAGSQTIATFERDSGTGFLSFLASNEVGLTAASAATALSVSSDGLNVYVATSYDNLITVFQRDAGSGLLKSVAALPNGPNFLGSSPQSIAVTSDGLNVFAAKVSIDGVTAFRRDPGSGALTFLGSYTRSDGVETVTAMGVSPDGSRVYVAGFTRDDAAILAYVRDPSTGGLALLGRSARTNNAPWRGARTMAVSPDNRQLYLASPLGAIAAFEVSP